MKKELNTHTNNNTIPDIVKYSDTPETAFRNFLEEYNVIPGTVAADGHKYRTGTPDKPRGHHVVYLLHPESADGWHNGWMRDYRRDVFVSFCQPPDGDGRQSTRQQTDPAAATRRKQALAEQAAERDAAKQSKQTAAAERARAVYAAARPHDPQHPYLVSKGVDVPADVRELSGPELYKLGVTQVRAWQSWQSERYLIVPLRDADGTIQTLQLIAGHRDRHGSNKHDLAGGRKSGSYYTIPSIEQAGTLYLVEGLSTGCSVAAAVDDGPVIVAVDAGNLPKVTAALASRYPGKTLVVCADNDTAGVKAALAAHDIAPESVKITFPGTVNDFNDLHVSGGFDAVRKYIDAATSTTYLLREYLDSECPDKRLLFLLPGQHLSDLPELADITDVTDAAIYAPPGSGKTYWTIRNLAERLPDAERLILYAPTRVLSASKARDTATGTPLHVIQGGSQYDPAERVQTSTYNGISKVWEQDTSRTTAVVDECHNLLTGQGYRADVLADFQRDLQTFKRRIYMTATPPPAGRLPQVQREYYVFSALPERHYQTIACRNKKATLFQEYGKTAGTKLVYTFGTRHSQKLCQEAREQGYKADYIISASEHNGSYRTEAHRQLVECQTIDPELDYLFVSSYPAEGVDVLEHNITRIILNGPFPAWLLFQFANRLRKSDPVPIVRLTARKRKTRKRQNIDWTRQTERQARDALTAEAQDCRNYLNHIEHRKGRTAAANLYKRMERALTGMLVDLADGENRRYETNPGKIEYEIYKEYETACRKSDDLYQRELTRYNILQADGRGKSGKTLTEAEKQAETAAAATLAEQYQADLAEAASLPDKHLLKVDPKAPPAKRHLSTLYQATGNHATAVKILQETGDNTRKVNQIKKQFAYRDYLESGEEEQTFDRIKKIMAELVEMEAEDEQKAAEKRERQAKKHPEQEAQPDPDTDPLKGKLTGEKAVRLLKRIYRADPALRRRYARKKLTPVKAMQDLQIFFSLERKTDRENAYYVITSKEPWQQYEDITLSERLSEALEKRDLASEKCRENERQKIAENDLTFPGMQANPVDTFMVDLCVFPKEITTPKVSTLPAAVPAADPDAWYLPDARTYSSMMYY